MKRTLISLTLGLFVVTTIWSQTTYITLTGGYALANLEETDTNANGFRINGLFEYNPNDGVLSHGFSIGYIGTTANSSSGQQLEYKLNNVPMYYAPKFTFGSGNFKPFVKGALGMHFSSYKRISNLAEFKDNDAGFYGGASVGAMFFISDEFYINLDYEWAYLSNSFYSNGFMNTFNLGVGYDFW